MGDDEISGCFEALVAFSLQLAAEMEMRGVIDGPAFTQRLRGEERPADQLEHMRICRLRLEQMADALDRMRENRNLRRTTLARRDESRSS